MRSHRWQYLIKELSQSFCSTNLFMALFIRGVHLAYPSSSPLSKRLFDIKCENGIVKTIREHEDKEDKANGTDEANAESGELDGRGGLLLPSYV